MATIVKINEAQRSIELDDTERVAEQGSESTGRKVPVARRSASTRIIKTLPLDDESAGVSAAATAQASQGRATSTLAGKISGATVGKNAAGSAGLMEFNLSDLAQQGREQIQRCREQVEVMLAEANRQAEAMKATAKTAGHAEGKQAAERDVQQRIEKEAELKAKARVQSLHVAVEQMRAQYDAWMQSYAEVLTLTAIAAAERLTRSRIKLANSDRGIPTPTESPISMNHTPEQESEHLLVSWARDALHSTRSASRLTLAVHPDTLAQLGKSLDELLAHPDLPEQSVVIPDETLAVGDIVVRQDGGEIQAGLDAQLQRLREELL
jgi:flagellar assembly protein FliH